MPWTIHPIAEFPRLASDWDALNTTMGALPFLEARFLAPLFDAFGAKGICVARWDDADGTAALGLLHRRAGVLWETYQPSQLPLGAWVMRPGLQFDTAVNGLARALPGAALAVSLTQLDPGVFARPEDTGRLRTLDYIRTARVDATGRFEDYWNARGKNLRQNMKKQRAKLGKDGVSIRLEVLVEPAQMAGAVADYGRLESAGWKAGGGTAIHADNPQGHFYRNMLEAFASAGRARVFCYRFDDRLVAMDLCIEGGGRLVILKTTYDESIRTVSPAFLMREESFAGLFADASIDAIEFFGKLMEWHTRWTDDVRTLYHVNWYRHSLLWRCRQWLRRRTPDSVPAVEAAAPSSSSVAT